MIQQERPSRTVETAVLESLGLRWAVLAAWCDSLRRHAAGLDQALMRKLEATRVKISTGAFSSCEVGCDLGQIEGELVSKTASIAPNAVDEWLGVLEQAMTNPERIKDRSSFRPVHVPYLDCGYRACACPA